MKSLVVAMLSVVQVLSVGCSGSPAETFAPRRVYELGPPTRMVTFIPWFAGRYVGHYGTITINPQSGGRAVVTDPQTGNQSQLDCRFHETGLIEGYVTGDSRKDYPWLLGVYYSDPPRWSAEVYFGRSRYILDTFILQ